MPEKCTFCRLAKGEIEFPGTFWEDEHHISFLSGHPNTLGFSVVIPKKHFGSDVLLMPDEDLSQLLIATKKVSSILVNFFDDVGRVGTITEGLGIDHAHVKIFPMHGTANLDKKWEERLSTVGTFFEQYEGYIASNEGPKADPEAIRKLAKLLKND